MGKFKSCLKNFSTAKKSTRVIAGINNPSTHCQPLFLKFGIMPLPSLYIYFSVIEIHKNISNFNTQSDTHSYSTRSADLLRTNRFRLKKSENNSLNLNLYNKLPSEVKSLNLNHFKKTTKKNHIKTLFLFD